MRKGVVAGVGDGPFFLARRVDVPPRRGQISRAMTPPDRPTPPLRAVRMAAKCPVCSKQVAAEYRPFCSKRCADIDLGRWLKEGYRVETEEAPIDEESDARRPTGQER